MKKLAIIVGHTQRSQGATNYLGESEYTFNSRIAKMMTEYIYGKYDIKNIRVKVFYRDVIGRSGVAALVKDWRADLSMELHFNSFKKKAYGCEILTLAHDTDSIEVADKITDEIAEKFCLRERHDDGVKELSDGDRGYYNLKLLESLPLVMLIEPCFANMKTAESIAIFEDERKYAIVLADQLVTTLIGHKPEVSEPVVGEAVVIINPETNEDGTCIVPETSEVDIPEGSLLEEKWGELSKEEEDKLKAKIEDLNKIINAQKEAWDDFCSDVTIGLDKAVAKSSRAWEEADLGE